jgi:hypothetical protein
MASDQLELIDDCYHKAEEGEPKFTLLARDPLAPFMVALWAAMRAGDIGSALSIFSDMNSDAGYKYTKEPSDANKVNSASFIAVEMNEWREAKGMENFGLHVVKIR